MVKIIEPFKEKKKLVEWLDEKTKKCGIVFFHGLGDVVQFIGLFNRLKELYPKIHFDIMLQKHLGQEAIWPDAVLLDDLNKIKKMDEYDYIFLVHFPVEQDPALTKSGLCCVTELGIPPMTKYEKLPDFPSKLIGVHFHNTALPGVFNPSEKVAGKIWNEVVDAGFVPIELAFKHPYHNPVNKKFGFVDCTVRGARATVPSLLGLVRACRGIICVPSGPLHCALSVMPDRVLYLEKSVPIERFTHLKISKVSIEDNKFEEGAVKRWVSKLG